MKKFGIAFLLSFFGLLALAQQGQLKESLSFKSSILDKAVKYSIFLPPGYETSNRSFPVLYLLHGYTDDETGWTQFGEVQITAEKMMQSGEVAPAIIVMPDGGVSFYINSADGKTNYEDFFMKEFIPFIDKTYHTRPAKRYRAIAGLSMGGYGSFIMAMKHPEMFAAAAPLSAAVLTDEEFSSMPDERWNPVWGVLFGAGLQGKDRLTEHWYKNSILKIAETTPVDELKKVRYYIDCGDDDFLIKGNMALHAVLKDRNIPHEFRVRDGVHNWTYWRTALPEVLKFVSESFHQP